MAKRSRAVDRPAAGDFLILLAPLGAAYESPVPAGPGFLGQALALARAAKATAVIELEKVPLREGVPARAESAKAPKGCAANLKALGRSVQWPEGLPPAAKKILSAPEPQEPLVAAVRPRELTAAMNLLRKSGQFTAVVGRLLSGPPLVQVE